MGLSFGSPIIFIIFVGNIKTHTMNNAIAINGDVGSNAMTNYSIYLMIELAKAANVLPKEMEYDLAWNRGHELYDRFTKSDWDDKDISEYQCILNFLEKDEPTLSDRIEAEDTFLHLSDSRGKEVMKLLYEKLHQTFGG
mgnify:CR=1 FL=1